MQAFVSVLKINFSKVGTAAEKIDRGEFAIQETSTKRQIDLCNDWETCFLPGQRVDMSMVFRRTVIDHSTCPGCAARRTANGLQENEVVECVKCGFTYTHQAAQKTPLKSRPSIISIDVPDSKSPGPRPYLPQSGSRLLKRKREDNINDEMRLFRRVRIIDEAQENKIRNLVLGAEVAYWHPGVKKGYWFQCTIIAIIYGAHVKQYGSSLCF